MVDQQHKALAWETNPNMEKDFIDFCNESVALSGYKGTSLKSWASVIAQLNTKYNQNFDQEALKNKWTYLKSEYILVRSLIHKTGHGRNEDGAFNWSDEVWEAEIEKNKNVAKFRQEPLKHFKELEQLFEGTFAVGDEQFNPARGDTVELEEDAMNVEELEEDSMNVDLESESDNFVDIEHDAYFSSIIRDASPGFPSARDASPGFPSARDASPGFQSARDASHGQGSIPVSNKTFESSQRKGKRKKKSQSDDLVDIIEILRSHVLTTQLYNEMLRKKMDLELEMLRKKMVMSREKMAMLRDKRACNPTTIHIEECCKIIEAMKDISDLDIDDFTYMSAKIALSASENLQVAFLTERTIENKVAFLKLIAK